MKLSCWQEARQEECGEVLTAVRPGHSQHLWLKNRVFHVWHRIHARLGQMFGTTAQVKRMELQPAQPVHFTSVTGYIGLKTTDKHGPCFQKPTIIVSFFQVTGKQFGVWPRTRPDP